MKAIQYPQQDATRQAREAMVHDQLIARGIRDSAVLKAMQSIPRHLFVPQASLSEAYADRALPINAGQTISQPFIVAYMLQALQLKPDDYVLEIGSGSGYAAALLSQLTSHVYTIERIPELASEARDRLHALGLRNITVYQDDGTVGLPRYAPYNAILVSAASPNIPQPLQDQLAEGGRMLIPIGSRQEQVLMGVTRFEQQIKTEPLCAVRFVPLLGAYAWATNENGE